MDQNYVASFVFFEVLISEMNSLALAFANKAK